MSKPLRHCRPHHHFQRGIKARVERSCAEGSDRVSVETGRRRCKHDERFNDSRHRPLRGKEGQRISPKVSDKRDAGQPCERRANIECDPRVPARDRRFLSRQANHSICRGFREAL